MSAAARVLDQDFTVRQPTIEMTASTPVDLAHLRRFTMGDQQLEDEVLGLFISEMPKYLAALKAARTDKDWKIAAHTIKGSARAVGAWKVARAASAAECCLDAVAEREPREFVIGVLESAATEADAFIAGLRSA